MTLDPVVRLCYVTVPAARLQAAKGDVQRLMEALSEQWKLTDLSVDSRVIGSVQAALIDGDGDATVAIRDKSAIVAVWSGFRDVALGIAFDVGSTTIAGYLCDLFTGETLASAGCINPHDQIR